ncbi:MAG: cupin domain-containing protein [Candidatus Omnitrophota bacterium]|jgi:mannose-6-phosphate isomerase-like protein (cupin superfamily)|nr:cupin domain-containing protein [Candidatus Omnitrophota bacterium]
MNTMNETSRVKLVKLLSGSKYQRLLSKESGTKNIKAGHVILQPAESIGTHSTGEREEVLVVLKGKGKAAINKETIDIESDNVLYIPPETQHDIKNTGPHILEYIFIVS